jgi:penicillin-binding protein 1C
VPAPLSAIGLAANGSGERKTVAVGSAERAWAKKNGFPLDETASKAAQSVRLSIAAPEQDAHLWRNPEVPPAV